jgi:hypothetical protein
MLMVLGLEYAVAKVKALLKESLSGITIAGSGG